MAKDLYDEFDSVRAIYNTADEIMGVSLTDISFNGPEDILRETRYTQPAIFVHSIAVYELLKQKNITPEAAAGHSLGEFSALVAAGVFSFEEALKLVKLRGELMFRSGTVQPGTMAAVIGLDENKIAEICETVDGVVVPANYNSPGQLVISGEVEAVRTAMVKMKEAGAKIVKELVVSGAFHSPLMADAISGLQEALKNADLNDAVIPVYQNFDGMAHTDKEEIRGNLLSQLTNPVRWNASMNNMLADGFNSFVEAGPNKVLKGLLKRIDRKAECLNAGTVEEINSL
jgi:[acyl-carrier-protein] S-malonyltransferase